MKRKLAYIFFVLWSHQLYGTPMDSLRQLLTQATLNSEIFLTIHLQLANALRKQGDLATATTHITTVEQGLIQNDFPTVKVHLLLTKGLVAYSQYQDEQALALFEEGYQLNQQHQAGFCFEFCSRLAKLTPPSEAEAYIKEGLDCTLGTSEIIALQEQLGNLYTQQEQYAAALQCFHNNLSIAKRINNPLLESNAYLNIGGVHLIEGKWKKAYNAYLVSADLKEKKGDQEGLIDVYHNIAAVYFYQKLYNKSLTYYQKCEDYYTSQQDTTELLEIWHNKAGVYIAEQKYEQASILLHQVLGLLEQFPNPTIALKTQMYLGNIYLKKENYPKALELFETALQTAQQQENQLFGVTINNFLGDVHYSLKDYDQSIVYHQKALSLSREFNTLEEQRSALFGLYESNKYLGKYQKALNWYEQYTTTKDSLYNVETTNAMAAMKAKYDNLEKEDSIKELHLENKNITIKNQNIVLENHLKTKQLYLSLLGSSLVMTILGMLWWYRHQRQKGILHQKKIHQLLKQQEIEILNAVVDAEQKERKHLAKEVHDTLGSFLAMLKLQHEVNKDLVDTPNYTQQHLLMEELIGQMATEVRNIAHQLYTGEQFSFDLKTAIQQLVSCIQNSQQLDIVFHYIGQPFELPRDLELVLYRVTQELLANALKHATASFITVQINQSSSEIMLMVEDDGRGFDTTAPQTGLGLRSIRARVESFAGTLQIDSQPKRGTTTVIIIPID